MAANDDKINEAMSIITSTVDPRLGPILKKVANDLNEISEKLNKALLGISTQLNNMNMDKSKLGQKLDDTVPSFTPPPSPDKVQAAIGVTAGAAPTQEKDSGLTQGGI